MSIFAVLICNGSSGDFPAVNFFDARAWLLTPRVFSEIGDSKPFVQAEIIRSLLVDGHVITRLQ